MLGRKLSRYVHKSYWPPVETSRVVELPGSRKKLFVFNAKSDRDGSVQPVLCICSRGNERLAFFDEEEVDELIRVTDRLEEYMKLWQLKAQRNRERADNFSRSEIASRDIIGVDI
jgi:hypothetical protein